MKRRAPRRGAQVSLPRERRDRLVSCRMRILPVLGLTLICGLPATGAHADGSATVCLAGTRDPIACLQPQEASEYPGLRPFALNGGAPATRVPRAGVLEASLALLGQAEPEDKAARVNPGVAFLMSAVLPGSGQLAEGRNRAFAYLSVEAIAWIAHFSWLDAGNKTEGEYEAYARGHWDLATWDSLAAESNPSCQALPPNVPYDAARDQIYGHLEAGDYQHYYEDIGKLEAYRSGWDDFDCDEAEAMSPNRSDYRGMREESNDYLDRARNAMTVIFLNHVISAVDAYRTAKGAHLHLPGGAEMKFKVAGSLERPKVGIRVTRAW